MTLEQLLIYGATAVAGWLLRHYGWFASNSAAPVPTKTTAPGSAAPAVPGTITSEIQQIVKDTITVVVQDELSKLRSTTAAPKS